MGVKDLQRVIKAYGKVVNVPGGYVAGLVDGNNLMYIATSVAVSDMIKQQPFTIFNSINADIPTQLHTLVHAITDAAVRTLHAIMRSERVRDMIVFFDPTTAPSYVINRSMRYPYGEGVTLGDTPYAPLLLGEADTIIMHLKESEQANRRHAREAATVDTSLEESIRNMPLDECTKACIYDVYKQSRYYTLQANWWSLRQLVIASMCELDDAHIRTIQCEVEADLAIKHYGMTQYHDGAPFLVLSSDTDYVVLFSDMPNAYYKSLTRNNPAVYNPQQVFKALLGDSYSYDIVIRLSPLLGNDYTSKSCIASADKIASVLALFNVGASRVALRNVSARTTMYRVMYNASEEAMNSTAVGGAAIPIVDRMIYDYDEKYFRQYLLSILTYSNLQLYDGYRYMSHEDAAPMRTKAYNDLQRALYKYCDGALLTWSYNGDIYDEAFHDSITIIDIHLDKDGCLEQYVADTSHFIRDLPDIA